MRQKLSNKTTPDLFVYDTLPTKFRVQAIGIWSDAIRALYSPMVVPYDVFDEFHKFIATEIGVFNLAPLSNNSEAAIVKFFMEADFDEALDALDMMFAGLTHLSEEPGYIAPRNDFGNIVARAISELNERFLQHDIGYALIGGSAPQIIRKDSEHLHKEVTMPALALLAERGFEGADEEYRKAHEHYRHGRHKECLNDCLKAFESTMKTICSRRKWTYLKTDTAKQLINVCLTNSLLPNFTESHLGTLRSALESAIPTVRNKMGGHGQGVQPTTVDPFFAEYLLHETAVTIVFLVSAFKALDS